MAQDSVDNELELKKWTTVVHSEEVNKRITSDFTLSKLNEQEKEAVIEITVNAFEATKHYNNMKDAWKWEYDKVERGLKQVMISEKEKKEIESHSAQVANTYMTRIYMLNIMNRNQSSTLIDGIIQPPEKEENVDDTIMNKIMEKTGLNRLKEQTEEGK